MAKKISCEEGFPITIERGVTLSIPWTYEDDAGDGIILTGKEIVFKLIFGSTVYTYNSIPNTYGSKTEVIDEDEGEFLTFISGDETALFDLTEGIAGRWWLGYLEGGNLYAIDAEDEVFVEDM